MVMLERAAEITRCFVVKLVTELEQQLLGRKNLLFLYETNWTLTLSNCLKALSSASLGTVMKSSYGKETFKHQLTPSYFYITESYKNLLQILTKYIMSLSMGVLSTWKHNRL
jgi:hypothetical protein